MSKVTFDGATKIISVNSGETEISVKTDLYSDWKEWTLIGDNSKYLSAMRSVGGDPISDVKQLGATYFLTNGWRIRPYEWNHRLTVIGNLFTEEGDSPFLSTIGNYNVTITNEVSTLVESTIQQLPQIEYASFNGGVTIDAINGTDSSVFPYGTPASPCKTLLNVSEITRYRGFKTIYVIGDITMIGIPPGTLIGYKIIGENSRRSTITISNVQFVDCSFENCTLTGTFANSSFVGAYNCIIEDLYNITIQAYNTSLKGNIELNDTESSNFYYCVDAVAGSQTPIIIVNDCLSLGIWNYSGGIKITNMISDGCQVSLNLATGRVLLDNTNTKGNITVRGIGTLSDTTNGTIVDSVGLLNKTVIADTVNEEIGTEIQYSTFDNMVTIDINSGSTGTTYPIGTPLSPVNNLDDALIIATDRGFNKIKTLSELTIYSGQTIDEFTIMSDNWLSVTVQSGVSLVNTNFEKVSLYGVMDGFWNVLIDCWVYDITNFCGWMRGGSYVSVELAPYTIESNGQSFFDDTLPMYPSIPSILKMNTDVSVSITNATDSYQINSMTSGSTLNIGFADGILIIDSSCTGGNIIVNGIGTLENNSVGPIVNSESLLDNNSISSYVWDKHLADHISSGTTGKALSTASSGGVDIQLLVDGVWNEPTSAHSTDGSFGKTISSGLTSIQATLDQTEIKIKYILGLEQHNFRIINQVYNSDNLLLSSTIRLYNNASDTTNNVNHFKEYTMEATYDSSGRITSYKVIEA